MAASAKPRYKIKRGEPVVTRRRSGVTKVIRSLLPGEYVEFDGGSVNSIHSTAWRLRAEGMKLVVQVEGRIVKVYRTG